MNDQVEQVKSKVDIVEVIGERVVLKKAGRHFKGLCPFHSEKSPSFIVSPERQSFKCFGCQEGGDVISFLEKYEAMSFLEALEFLAKRVGITLQSYQPSSQDAYKKKLLEVMSMASEYYHYLLTKHESGRNARDYLAKRGITSEAIKQFKLGYAPNQWRSVSDYLIGKKKYGVEDLQSCGLVIESDRGGFYDRFRGRVMFPLRDHKGVVVGFSGRTLLADEKEAKYINSPETMLYSKSKLLYGLWENREYIRKADSIVMVEGELDMIPSWQAGVKNVVAIKGSAFTSEQAQLIARMTHNIVLSMDADLAGQESIKRAVIIAENIDLSIRVVQIRGGKDPGDVASESAKAWKEMIKGAVLYWDFLIDSAVARFDPQSGAGAKSIAGEVIPEIAQISNSVMRAHYVSKLAKQLSVPEESIYSEIERAKKKQELKFLKQTVSQIESGKINRRESVEEYLLSLAMQFYPQVQSQLAKFEIEWVSSLAISKILERVKKLDPTKKFKISVLASELPPELQPALDEAYLRDISHVEKPEREFEQKAKEIQEMYAKAELKKLAFQIAEAEASGEVTEELQTKFVSLSRSLS